MARTRFISMLSGKGGVGKSVLTLNLADQLVALGYRTLAVDADFSSGNLHVLANISVEHGLNEFFNGTRSLREAVTTVRGLDILPATWCAPLAEERSIQHTAHLMELLRTETGEYDFVLFDHGSGRSNQAVLMAHASDLNFLVVVPELTSLADAYGLFKHIVAIHRKMDCRILINRAQSEEEAEYIRVQMKGLAEKFLRERIGYQGYVSEDVIIRQAIASQQPLSLMVTAPIALTQLQSIAQALGAELTQPATTSFEASKTQINKRSATADIRG